MSSINIAVRKEVHGDGTIDENKVPNYKETTEHVSKIFGTLGHFVTNPCPERNWPCFYF
jgi:hypothetical protein